VSDQLGAPAALFPGKETPLNISLGRIGPQWRSGRGVEDRNTCSSRKSLSTIHLELCTDWSELWIL